MSRNKHRLLDIGTWGLSISSGQPCTCSLWEGDVIGVNIANGVAKAEMLSAIYCENSIPVKQPSKGKPLKENTKLVVIYLIFFIYILVESGQIWPCIDCRRNMNWKQMLENKITISFLLWKIHMHISYLIQTWFSFECPYTNDFLTLILLALPDGIV